MPYKDPEKRREYGKKWNKNNVESKKKNDHEYYLKNRDKIIDRSSEYYKENKYIILENRRNYILCNRDKFNIICSIYRRNNKYNINKRERKYGKLYRSKNKITIKENQKIYYKNNRDKILNNVKLYHIDHPEIALKSNIKYIKKISGRLNMNCIEYKFALQSWSRLVRIRDNFTCQICDGKANIAHHILYKSQYPELMFNLNNGVSLCNDCHYNYHDLNGWKQ